MFVWGAGEKTPKLTPPPLRPPMRSAGDKPSPRSVCPADRNASELANAGCHGRETSKEPSITGLDYIPRYFTFD